MKKILLLGGSSWIGEKIVRKLSKETDINLIATYNTHEYDLGCDIIQFDYNNPQKLFDFIRENNPDIVINCLKGNDKQVYTFHDDLISALKDVDSKYVFISSSMVFDGALDKEHKEGDTPKPVGEYGNFKYYAEESIYDSGILHIVFRFSAIHGYSPIRLSRTEKFLIKLKNREKITVDQGVVQNRLLVDDLVEMMVEIIKKNGFGLFHLGTVDQSEEYDFLKKIAVKFGYPSNSVNMKSTSNKKILVTVVERAWDLLGDEYKRTEQETIDSVYKIPEFEIYKNNN